MANRTRMEQETWRERWQLLTLSIATWCFLGAAVAIDHGTPISHTVVLGLFAAAYLSGGGDATRHALTDLRHWRINIDLLMLIAAIGAAMVNAWAEGAVLLALFSTSNALEHAALERTRHAVQALMELSPDTATVLREDGERQVHVSDLAIGDRVLVRPGDRVPIDGVVIFGESSVDQSAITGESAPVRKSRGDAVFAASINQGGALEINVAKPIEESVLSKIVAFVEKARSEKSATQRFTDAFEGRYAVGVIAVSIAVFAVPWLCFGRDAHDSFYRAITLLVVASPCALVISTPASTLSALANAARHGVLFKGGSHLEQMGSLERIVFDKTGTLTSGRQRLTDVLPIDSAWSADQLLCAAASVEYLSEHHLARALVTGAHDRAMTLDPAADFEALPGMGVRATLNGRRLWVGNDAMAAHQSVSTDAAHRALDDLREQGKSAVMVGDADGVVGVIAVADTLRPESPSVVKRLHSLGIDHLAILTGDNHRVAHAVGLEVGIGDVRAGLLPEDKLNVIREFAANGSVAMVGDGVNDAPALAIASLGIAMGGTGTDVALETADVVLLNDTLEMLPYAVALGRRTRRTIVQNLAFSLSVITVLVTCSLTIGVPLPLGVVGHEGSTVLVVLNGLRLLRSTDG